MDLLQREHPKILAGIGVGYEKVAFGSLKCSKMVTIDSIEDQPTNRKYHTRFQLVPKSTTLDNLEGSLSTLFCKHAPLTTIHYLLYLQSPENKQIVYRKQLVMNDSKML